VAIPTLRLAGEPSKKLMHPSTIGCRFTVPVRSFRGAQSRRKRTARRWTVYRRRPGGLSTGKRSLSGPGASSYSYGGTVFRAAALRPYSWLVLGLHFEGWNRSRGAASHHHLGQLTRSRAVIDWPWANRHRAVLIQRPADGIWGSFSCGKPLSIAGAGDGELGPITVARRISIETGRGHRTRQRAAAVGRRRHQRFRRSPSRLGAVVCWHDSYCLMRRCFDGRRRIHFARR